MEDNGIEASRKVVGNVADGMYIDDEQFKGIAIAAQLMNVN